MVTMPSGVQTNTHLQGRNIKAFRVVCNTCVCTLGVTRYSFSFPMLQKCYEKSKVLPFPVLPLICLLEWGMVWRGLILFRWPHRWWMDRCGEGQREVREKAKGGTLSQVLDKSNGRSALHQALTDCCRGVMMHGCLTACWLNLFPLFAVLEGNAQTFVFWWKVCIPGGIGAEAALLLFRRFDGVFSCVSLSQVFLL